MIDRSRERLPALSIPSVTVPAGPDDADFFAILPQGVRVEKRWRMEVHLSAAGGKAHRPAGSKQTAAPKSHAEVTKALNTLELTPIQRLSIRDYVGEGKAEVQELSVNGKEVLILRDPKTHDYIGEATISARDDGSVVVSKLTGSTFSTTKSVEIPISDKETEDAAKVLKGTESLKTFNSEKDDKGGIELSVPAISIEGSMQYGPVADSTAVFNKDGSGYERGMRTNLAAVSGGAEAGASGKSEGDGFVGVKGGASADAFKVEVFANYFSAPEANEKGEFTRSVLGASGEAHATLAELAGQVGCSEEGGCAAKASAGFLGFGTGFGLNYGAKVKLERGAAEGIPAEGLASSEEQVAAADTVPAAPVEPPASIEPVPAPTPTEEDADADDDGDEDGDAIDDQEREDYQAAVEDGSVEALEGFLAQYPDSVYEADVREEEDAAAHPDQVPGDETRIY